MPPSGYGRAKTEEELRQEEADAQLAQSLQDEERRVAQERRSHGNARQQGAPAAPAAPSGSTVQITCPHCGRLNNVVIDGQTFYLCGACRKNLPNPNQQRQQSPQQPQQRTVQQGYPASGPPTNSEGLVSVRCPTCKVINRVPGGPGTPFMCGACSQTLRAPSGAVPTGPQQPAHQQQQSNQHHGAAGSAGSVAPLSMGYKARVNANGSVACGCCGIVNSGVSPGMVFKCGSCRKENTP